MEQQSQQLQQHFTIVGLLHFGLSAFTLLVVGAVVAMMIAAGLFSGGSEAMIFIIIISLFIGGLTLFMAAPGIVGGIGLLRRRPWARWLLIFVGFLNLFNFPFGTAVGAYTLWVLLQPEAEILLAEPAGKFA